MGRAPIRPLRSWNHFTVCGRGAGVTLRDRAAPGRSSVPLPSAASPDAHPPFGHGEFVRRRGVPPADTPQRPRRSVMIRRLPLPMVPALSALLFLVAPAVGAPSDDDLFFFDDFDGSTLDASKWETAIAVTGI